MEGSVCQLPAQGTSFAFVAAPLFVASSISISPSPSSLPLALSLSLAPAPVLHLPRFLVFYYPVLSPPPHPTSPRSVSPLMFCSLQRSIIFRPNDFTSRLDRSTTPTDVIAVRGHHMISQMSSCQHRRLVDFFISYPLISVLQLSTSSSSVPKYCIFYII